MTERTSTKMAAAAIVMTTTLVGSLGGIFAVVTDPFPWMTVVDRVDEDPRPRPAPPVEVVDLTSAGETPASRAIDSVLDGTPLPLRTGGWTEVAGSRGVAAASFGFGCDPEDGTAPVVARTRAFVRTERTSLSGGGGAASLVSVTAQALPAGGGAVVFAGLRDAVQTCAGADWFVVEGLGVEAAQVRSSDVAAMVWRRGDVLVVFSSRVQGGAGDLGVWAPVVEQLDERLRATLDDVCAEPSSTVAHAARSPYLDRDGYVGFGRSVKVVRDQMPSDRSAEAVALRAGVAPVSRGRAAARRLSVPAAPVLPLAPVPAPTRGPTALPDVVASPVAPTVPAAPARSTRVLRLEVDRLGPGCGWAFTGQPVPRFSRDRARAAYTDDVRAAKQKLASAWEDWQDARLAYFRDAARHEAAVEQYVDYVRAVADARAAWTVIDEARAEYTRALADYLSAVRARDAFKARKAAARDTYRDAKRACRGSGEDSSKRADEPGPSDGPSPTTTTTPTTQPSASPTRTPTTPPPTSPTTVAPACPPTRPAILGQQPPAVPVSPTPAAKAQLP